MKYEIQDPKNDDRFLEVPSAVIDNIIKDYLVSKYYWTLGFGMFIIGFLVGVIV